MKHDVLPRIIAFDQVTLRRMSTMALDVGKYPPSYASCPVWEFLCSPPLPCCMVAGFSFWCNLCSSLVSDLQHMLLVLQLRNASDVCYTRANFVGVDQQQAPTPLHPWRTDHEQPGLGSPALPAGDANVVVCPLPRIPHPSGTIGPNEYFLYQTRQYPHLVRNIHYCLILDACLQILLSFTVFFLTPPIK
jgi:hypothetical protein